MGAGDITTAVADAGPLIHLSEIDCLPLLRMIGRLHIAQAVHAETVGRGRLTADSLLAAGNIELHILASAEVDGFMQTNCMQNLHIGESESLYLSLWRVPSLISLSPSCVTGPGSTPIVRHR